MQVHWKHRGWMWHTLSFLSVSVTHTHRHNLLKSSGGCSVLWYNKSLDANYVVNKTKRPWGDKLSGIKRCHRSKFKPEDCSQPGLGRNPDQELSVEHLSLHVLHMYRPDLGQITTIFSYLFDPTSIRQAWLAAWGQFMSNLFRSGAVRVCPNDRLQFCTCGIKQAVGSVCEGCLTQVWCAQRPHTKR